jgi:hypothetical protein
MTLSVQVLVLGKGGVELLVTGLTLHRHDLIVQRALLQALWTMSCGDAQNVTVTRSRE